MECSSTGAQTKELLGISGHALFPSYANAASPPWTAHRSVSPSFNNPPMLQAGISPYGADSLFR
jgi:hypothetical protein